MSSLSPQDAPPPGSRPARIRPLALSLGLLTLVLDRTTKAIVEPYLLRLDPPSVEVLGDALRLTYVRNTGVVFGILAGSSMPYRRELLSLLSLAAIIALAVYFARLPATRRVLLCGLGLVLGGALSNVVDRIAYGFVVDFIDVSLHFRDWRWHVFNVADAAIVAGVVLMAIDLLRSPPPEPAVEAVER